MKAVKDYEQEIARARMAHNVLRRVLKRTLDYVETFIADEGTGIEFTPRETEQLEESINNMLTLRKNHEQKKPYRNSRR